MTDAEKIAFKNSLKRWGLDLIGQRMAAARAAMEQAQEAANSEEKSSAGDKYETGRAMGHLQKDMHARQLAESAKELATLHAVQTEPLCHEGRAGALVQADGLAFFISAGLGKQSFDGQTILFLSPQAPLGKMLEKKKPGDKIRFNQKDLVIRDVF
jgi:hypothetical protein